jgi:hypothetical protein
MLAERMLQSIKQSESRAALQILARRDLMGTHGGYQAGEVLVADTARTVLVLLHLYSTGTAGSELVTVLGWAFFLAFLPSCLPNPPYAGKNGEYFVAL